MRDRIEVDSSARPLVMVRFVGLASDEMFRGYLMELDAVLAEGSRYVVVLDARESISGPRHHQRWQAEWLKTNRDALREHSCGTAFVIDSAINRFVLSAVFLIQRPPNPYVVVGTLNEGLDWAESRLRSSGIEVPPSAERFRE